MNNPQFRSGFVTILGKPNTGKSTLMNRLIGEKISITSPKPQTTRYNIKGILNRDDCQIIFIDTPGYLKPRYKLQEKMQDLWSESYKDVDLILFMSDVLTFPTDYDLEVLELLKKIPIQQIAVFNKIDLKNDYSRDFFISPLPESCSEAFFISATRGDGVPELMEDMLKYIPYHPPYYSEDELSDLPMRFFAQEFIREAIFNYFSQEIPYSTAVLVEKFKELDDRIHIDAVIWLERESQKPIIIGKNGNGLAKIRDYAEQQLTNFMGIPVMVHLWVKVKPKWRKKPSDLKELGFK